MGCAGSLMVAALFRKLNRKNMRLALKQGTNITVLIFLVLLGGVILGHGLSNFGVPQYLISLVTDANLSRNTFLLTLTIFYIILGCFLDGSAVLVVTLPIVFPVVSAVGIDRIWFGVIMVIFCEIAAITPPVGVNLFVLQGVTKKPLEQIISGVFPFIFFLLFLELILILFPQIALYLPSMMY
jgi:C4-dicarboxylate transporter DctM subunit